MTQRPRTKHRSNTRIVHYGWGLPDPREAGCYVRDIFDESAMDKLLYAARTAGVISMQDCGRGATVWFEGPPGPAMRALRDKVLVMLPAGVVRLR